MSYNCVHLTIQLNCFMIIDVIQLNVQLQTFQLDLKYEKTVYYKAIFKIFGAVCINVVVINIINVSNQNRNTYNGVQGVMRFEEVNSKNQF